MPRRGGNADRATVFRIGSDRTETLGSTLVALVEHIKRRLAGRAKLFEKRLGRLQLRAVFGVGRVYNHRQNVRRYRLFQSRTERVHQMVRQFADETDRIGQKHIGSVRQLQLARGRIKRGKQLVLGKNARVGQIPVQSTFHQLPHYQ